jgi:succinate dehydrogenase flavin-adding protein (antitoxin of CptAB toxin-antitoxin module)
LSRVSKFLGLGVVEVDFVFFNLFARSSVSSLDEEKEEEEELLEEDEELLLSFMLLSLAFTDSLSTLAVCVKRTPEAESEEELPMTIGLWWSSSMASLST